MKKFILTTLTLVLLITSTSLFSSTDSTQKDEYEITAFYKKERVPDNIIILNNWDDVIDTKNYLVQSSDNDIKSGEYQVTRIADNLYKVEDFLHPFYFKTKWCSEWGTRKKAQIVVDGYWEKKGKIIFKR